MTKQKSFNIGPILLEMIMIFLGVYFAMILSNWNEETKNKESVIVHLSNMINELEKNINLLKPKIQYHEEIATHLRKQSQDIYKTHGSKPYDSSLFRELVPFKGTQTPTLQMSSYQVYINSGLANYNSIQVRNDLSQTYALMNDYKSYSSLYFSQFLNINSQKTMTDAVSLLHSFSEDAVGIETVLNSLMKTTLSSLKEELKSFE